MKKLTASHLGVTTTAFLNMKYEHLISRYLGKGKEGEGKKAQCF